MKIDDENKYDWIERYLDNELNEAELKFFEQARINHPAFAEEVNRQVEAQKTLENILFENQIRQEARALWQEDDETVERTPFANNSRQVALRPSKITSRYWQLAAVLVGILAISWGVLYYNDWFEPKIVANPLDSLKEKIVKQEPQKTPQDSGKSIIEPKPNNQQIVDNQKVMEKKTAQILQIEELIIKTTRGYSGNLKPEKTQRPLLILDKSPMDSNVEKYIIYRLADTLKIYGIADAQKMQLLYREELAKYYLIVEKDTFPLNYRTRKWQFLKKNEGKN
ncbi:MAG: hypothetical protein MUE85_20095 [Microscillaceae bacterium]|jgi:hypothetical protein|nr:hypothetical protein [Microscillaceae bacterium]